MTSTLKPDYRLNRGQIEALLILIQGAASEAEMRKALQTVDRNALRSAKLKLELQHAWLD